MNVIPKVVLVGGPDIDSRLDMMQLMKNKFEFVAIGTNLNLHGIFQEKGYSYYYYPLGRRVNPLSDVIAIIQLIKLFLREKPLIVHTFDTKPCVIARIAAKLARVPVIVGTIPGLGILYNKAGMKYSIIRILYEPLQKIACHLSNVTIFQNDDDRRIFISHGISPEEKSCIIPGSGVQTEKFDVRKFNGDDRIRIREEFNIQDDHIVISMVSRLTHSKGVIEFCDAANRLIGESNLKFLLVGPLDNDCADPLNEDDIEYMRESVIWAGQRHDIENILYASDIFVLPTSYGEGIPRVLLEAASMGLPLIATDLPGCKAIIEGGENGILIPPQNSMYLVQAIRTIVSSNGLQKKFGGKARSNAVSFFDLKIIVEKTERLYADLLKNSREQ